MLGRWRVLHGDEPLPRGRVVHGHEHPCVRWAGGVVAPCYLVGRGRLVLPALSPDAAGVNVLHDRRWAPFRCCVILPPPLSFIFQCSVLAAAAQ